MGDVQENDQPNSGNFLERNHKKMLWVAFAANVLSWTVLVFCIISFILGLVQTYRILQMYSQSPSIQNSPQKPDYLLLGTYIFNAISSFFTGIVYIIVLRGVSLGLRMLVETSLNYKLSREEENHA
jgi:hypothetical protein